MYASMLSSFIGIFLILLCPQPGVGFHQGDPKNNNSQTVTMWVSEVSTANPDIWTSLGRFQTYEEASECSLRWSKANPQSLKLTREREIQVRIIPPGSGDKPKDSQGPPPDSKRGGSADQQKPPPPKGDPMAGMWGADCGSFYFSNGRFTHICSGTPLQGTYQLNGDRIQLSFENGTLIAGSLKNGRVEGTMNNPKRGTSKPFTFTKK